MKDEEYIKGDDKVLPLQEALSQPSSFIPHPSSFIPSSPPLICVPLVASEVGEAVGQAERLAALKPDLIEVRLDYLKDLTPQVARSLLSEIQRVCSVPLMVTFRRKEEGGARDLDEAGRVAILLAALESGAVRILDVELRTGLLARSELLKAARQREVATLISYHDFKTTPPYAVLIELLKELAATGADIVKLAVYPRTPTDTLNLLAATQEAATTFLKVPLVTMAMGALGGFTRLAGPFFGSAISFAVGEQSSAPGQLKIDTMRELWENWGVRT